MYICIKNYNMLESKTPDQMEPLSYILLRDFVACISNLTGRSTESLQGS